MPTKKTKAKKDKRKPDEPTARLIRAIGHPLRRDILGALATERGSASTLSERFDEPLSNVSYHLNQVLFAECGVVELVGTRQVRGAYEKVYVLKDASYLDGFSWPSIPQPIRDGLLGSSLKGFFSIVIASLKSGALNGTSTLRWRPLLVDERGQVEVSEAIGEAAERIEAAKRKSATRLSKTKSRQPQQMIVGLAAFRPSELPTGSDG